MADQKEIQANENEDAISQKNIRAKLSSRELWSKLYKRSGYKNEPDFFEELMNWANLNLFKENQIESTQDIEDFSRLMSRMVYLFQNMLGRNEGIIEDVKRGYEDSIRLLHKELTELKHENEALKQKEQAYEKEKQTASEQLQEKNQQLVNLLSEQSVRQDLIDELKEKNERLRHVSENLKLSEEKQMGYISLNQDLEKRLKEQEDTSSEKIKAIVDAKEKENVQLQNEIGILKNQFEMLQKEKDMEIQHIQRQAIFEKTSAVLEAQETYNLKLAEFLSIFPQSIKKDAETTD